MSASTPPALPLRPGHLQKTGHARALEARARKRAEAEAMGIDEAFISDLVERFYGKIRQDALLGPIFAAQISEWPAHLARMKQFWRSILHNSGEFTGNPMHKHMMLPQQLGQAHFAHWLELFYATLRDGGARPEAVREIGSRARMIADSLLTGITLHHSGPGGGLSGARAGDNLPHP